MYSELPVEDEKKQGITNCDLCVFFALSIALMLMGLLYVISAIYVVLINWFNWLSVVNSVTVMLMLGTLVAPPCVTKCLIMSYFCSAVACSVTLQVIQVDDNLAGIVTMLSFFVNCILIVIKAIICMEAPPDPQIPLLLI